METHGSIKHYEYTADKYKLQEVVEKVIRDNKNIILDTTNNYFIDKTNQRNDTVRNNYYNDGDRYVTINIKSTDGMNEYIFQYSGDKAYWDTARKSDISIAYAYDQDGNGGSEGNGGINWYNWNLKEKLLAPFERELISNIDKALKQKHTEGN